jgi:hypothetical protein
MTGSTDIEAREIHLSASRRRGTINASLLACASFGLAVLVAVIVLEQPHLPSGTAGYVLTAAIVAGFVALGYRATRAALRARRSGVTINPNGIVLRNPSNDIPLSWDEIAGFDAATDASGMAGTNPYVVGKVALHDGRSYYIEGTRLGGALWRRARRQEEVQRCVRQLNELLTQRHSALTTSDAH